MEGRVVAAAAGVRAGAAGGSVRKGEAATVLRGGEQPRRAGAEGRSAVEAPSLSRRRRPLQAFPGGGSDGA